MTLAQIMKLALRQLDEDPADISEYDEMFRVYANHAYRIAVEDYVKPRDMRKVESDDKGYIRLDEDMRRIVELREIRKDGEMGPPAQFYLTDMGRMAYVPAHDKQYACVCEIAYPDMENGNEAPRIPQELHPAIADYICYCHLLNGNLAKQSRAQQYLVKFRMAMDRVRPQGMGSVRHFENLYAVTDVRYTR